MMENINKLFGVKRLLSLELNREPTDEEIAKAMGLSTKKVGELIRISKDPVSLETPVGEDDDSFLYDFLPSNDCTPEEEYDND